MLSVFKLSGIMLSVFKLSGIMLSVFKLSGIILSVIKLHVTAPNDKGDERNLTFKSICFDPKFNNLSFDENLVRSKIIKQKV